MAFCCTAINSCLVVRMLSVPGTNLASKRPGLPYSSFHCGPNTAFFSNPATGCCTVVQDTYKKHKYLPRLGFLPSRGRGFETSFSITAPGFLIFLSLSACLSYYLFLIRCYVLLICTAVVQLVALWSEYCTSFFVLQAARAASGASYTMHPVTSARSTARAYFFFAHST